MRRFVPAVFALSSLFLGGACVSDPTSPWEITVQLERRVDLLDGRATIAVRAVDVEDPEVIVHLECESEERTVQIVQGVESPEICGMTYTLSSLRLRATEPVSATLLVQWDSDSSSE